MTFKKLSFLDKKQKRDKSVNKFLYAQYKGHCQICSKQMTDKDDNLIWHAFSLFKPGEGNTDASLPVAWDKVCVCFTCKATLQYGNVSLREFLPEALATPPYKSEKKLKFRIRIQNETTNITYTTKHLKHLQTALSGDSGKARIKRFRYDI